MYETENDFNAETLQHALRDLLTQGYDEDDMCWENMNIQTFEEAGILTYNKGLVISMPDGTEYQLTIVQSR